MSAQQPVHIPPAEVETRPSLVLNALSNWVALGLNGAAAFLLTPYIIRCLGVNGYGIWRLIASVVGYYAILDLGVSSAVTRYVARYAGQRDYKALNETVSTALTMFCVIGLVVIGGSLLLASPLARFFEDLLVVCGLALFLQKLDNARHFLFRDKRAVDAHEPG